MNAVLRADLKVLSSAVELSYEIQLEEGMQELPNTGELSKKYCGGGHGGYALYMFENPIEDERLIKIQPYMKWSE